MINFRSLNQDLFVDKGSVVLNIDILVQMDVLHVSLSVNGGSSVHFSIFFNRVINVYTYIAILLSLD